jgi:hypothetical protein
MYENKKRKKWYVDIIFKMSVTIKSEHQHVVPDVLHQIDRVQILSFELSWLGDLGMIVFIANILLQLRATRAILHNY